MLSLQPSGPQCCPKIVSALSLPITGSHTSESGVRSLVVGLRECRRLCSIKETLVPTQTEELSRLQGVPAGTVCAEGPCRPGAERFVFDVVSESRTSERKHAGRRSHARGVVSRPTPPSAYGARRSAAAARRASAETGPGDLGTRLFRGTAPCAHPRKTRLFSQADVAEAGEIDF